MTSLPPFGASIAGGQSTLGGSAADAIANVADSQSQAKYQRLDNERMELSEASRPPDLPPIIQTPSINDVLRSHRLFKNNKFYNLRLSIRL